MIRKRHNWFSHPTEPRKGHFFSNIYEERTWKQKELEKKSKQQYLVQTTYHLSFPILSRIEIKTRKLERKSKQEISRLNNLSSSFSNHPPYFSGDYLPIVGKNYIDLTRYYVIKSRYLSCINDLMSFIYSVNIGKER